MAASTVVLNLGAGGSQPLVDTLTTVDGVAAPASSVVQVVKAGFGVAGDVKTVSKAQPLPVEQQAATLWISVTAASGVAITATLPAPAAGLFHYITSLDISLYAAVARVGAAAPVLVTTTNIPGSPVLNFPTAQAIGAIDRDNLNLTSPIKSSLAATATTIVCPAATTGIWRVNVGYYTAP
jgi:hypothetical protein